MRAVVLGSLLMYGQSQDDPSLAVGAWLPDRFLGDDDRRWVFALFVGIISAGMFLYIVALGVAIAWNVKGFPIFKPPRWLTRKYF